GHLHLHVVGLDEPACRDLGGLDLVLQRNLQEVGDVQRPLHLRPEGRVGGEAGQDLLVRGVQLGRACYRGHAATPSRRMRGSSWVRVSFVTTRSQRPCSGWVSRARACVVKPSTGTRGVARSSAPSTASESQPLVVRSRITRSAGPAARAGGISSGARAKSSGVPTRRAVSRMRATKKRSFTTAITRVKAG